MLRSNATIAVAVTVAAIIIVAIVTACFLVPRSKAVAEGFDGQLFQQGAGAIADSKTCSINGYTFRAEGLADYPSKTDGVSKCVIVRDGMGLLQREDAPKQCSLASADAGYEQDWSNPLREVKSVGFEANAEGTIPRCVLEIRPDMSVAELQALDDRLIESAADFRSEAYKLRRALRDTTAKLNVASGAIETATGRLGTIDADRRTTSDALVGLAGADVSAFALVQVEFNAQAAALNRQWKDAWWVKTFEHIDYGGAVKSYPPGLFDTGAHVDIGSISSIKVPAGMWVQVFSGSNKGGDTAVFETDQPDLTKVARGTSATWNDAIRSFLVGAGGPAPEVQVLAPPAPAPAAPPGAAPSPGTKFRLKDVTTQKYLNLDGSNNGILDDVGVTFVIASEPNVYDPESRGAVAVQIDGGPRFLRHGGMIVHQDPFLNHPDFIWVFIRASPDSYTVFNYFGGGTYLDYNGKNVLISSNAERRTWSLAPPLPTTATVDAAPPPAVADPGGVTIIGHNGVSKLLTAKGAGEANYSDYGPNEWGGIPNDGIKSVKVPPGYRIRLFQHWFTGYTADVTSDQELADIPTPWQGKGYWQDNVSSVTVWAGI
jgi:hypothetical protein